MNLVLGRNRIACSTMKISSTKHNFSSSTTHSFFSRTISSAPTSSSSFQSNLANKILNSKSASEALQLYYSSSKNIDPTKNLKLHSATVHFLTNVRLYLKARCLIKDLIQTLRTSCPPHRLSSLLFHALNQPQLTTPKTKVFGVLIIALTESGFVDQAYWVLKKTPELPATHICNRILDQFLKLGRFNSLWEVYSNITSRARVMFPSDVTYGILIDACCQEGDTKTARKLFDEMIERGLTPTVVIYTTLIHGLCSEGKMLEAESMFADMNKAGVLPNLYTFNALLDGHSKMANVNKALNIYQEILITGLNPNCVTFGILVDMFMKTNSTLAAESCFAQMTKCGETPNLYIYNCFIDGCCKEGNLSAAVSLLSEMEISGIANDVFTYCILINGYCKTGRLKEAENLLKEMSRKGIDANSAVYNALINGYSKAGNMVKALELCGQMVVNGVEVNIITYSTLIDGYCKVKDMKSAMGLYTEMVIKGVTPDIVAYTALIDGHFKDCNTKAALRVYNEMVQGGLTPNVFTISCLIDGLCKDGLTNDAIKIFLDNGYCSPNSVLYTSLICGLCKDGQVFKASKFFSDMRSMGLKADVELYVVIIQWHFKTKHVHGVLMLHADMLKGGVIPNDVIYGVFARGYREIGDYKSAFRCSDDLLQSGSFCQRDLLTLEEKKISITFSITVLSLSVSSSRNGSKENPHFVLDPDNGDLGIVPQINNWYALVVVQAVVAGTLAATSLVVVQAVFEATMKHTGVVYQNVLEYWKDLLETRSVIC